jgi:hypothetical protein
MVSVDGGAVIDGNITEEGKLTIRDANGFYELTTIDGSLKMVHRPFNSIKVTPINVDPNNQSEDILGKYLQENFSDLMCPSVSTTQNAVNLLRQFEGILCLRDTMRHIKKGGESNRFITFKE